MNRFAVLPLFVALEAEWLDLDPVVLAAGALAVAASTIAHALTGAPGRALHRAVATRPARISA